MSRTKGRELLLGCFLILPFAPPKKNAKETQIPARTEGIRTEKDRKKAKKRQHPGTNQTEVPELTEETKDGNSDVQEKPP